MFFKNNLFVCSFVSLQNLLYRRLRRLANYETANRNLEKARAKNKDVHLVSFKIHQIVYHFQFNHL